MNDGLDEIPVSGLSDGAHRFGHNDPFFVFCKAKFAMAQSGARVRDRFRAHVAMPGQLARDCEGSACKEPSRPFFVYKIVNVVSVRKIAGKLDLRNAQPAGEFYKAKTQFGTKAIGPCAILAAVSPMCYCPHVFGCRSGRTWISHCKTAKFAKENRDGT